MGEGVDGDPVAGLPGGAAQELPGALGILGQEPVEQAEREPARLELGLGVQPGGDLEVAGRALARVAVRNPRSTAAVSGQRTPYVRPIPGAIRWVPARYSGSASVRKPAVRVVGEGIGVADEIGQRCRPRASAAGLRSATKRDRARGHR